MIFLVVFAFLWKTGFVCPPYPLCFLSYLLFPCAYREAFPVLYWVTVAVEVKVRVRLRVR